MVNADAPGDLVENPGLSAAGFSARGEGINDDVNAPGFQWGWE
jgi:hypothetical protein